MWLRVFDGEETMFDDLDEQIAHEQSANSTRTQRTIRHVVVGALSVLLFGALFWAVWLLEF